MSKSFPSKFKTIKYCLSFLNQKQVLNKPHLKQIQSHLIILGALSDPYISGKLVSHYTLLNSVDDAYKLFNILSNRTAFIWNTMIKTLVDNAEPVKALSLYQQMLRDDHLPNNYTFSFSLKACCEISDGVLGFLLHVQVIKLGWEDYDFVQNGLIHFYTCCNCMAYARKLFEGCCNRDVVTWTALINGYVKSGELDVARRLFDRMEEKNSVTWSAMINGYVQAGMFKEALEVFSGMQVEGFRPNHAGMVSALTACAFLGALEQGRWIHAYMKRNRMELDRVLGTALIDMYAKCGWIEMARCVFEEMVVKDVFAYTSLISGLANHNDGVSALELFARMCSEGVRPNEVTFICVLSACSRMGLVDKGLRIFDSMRKVYGISPGVQHYGCLVDLLGRAGMVKEAKKVVEEMAMEPDSYVLGALLNACRVHGNVNLGKDMVEWLAKKRLDHSGVHVLLSNIYASEYSWDNVAKVREGMEENQVKKVPGCSLIEIGAAVQEFIAGDQSHMLMEDILLSLQRVDGNLKSLWLNDDDDITMEHVSLARIPRS